MMMGDHDDDVNDADTTKGLYGTFDAGKEWHRVYMRRYGVDKPFSTTQRWNPEKGIVFQPTFPGTPPNKDKFETSICWAKARTKTTPSSCFLIVFVSVLVVAAWADALAH